jgi:hypothetical protein
MIPKQNPDAMSSPEPARNEHLLRVLIDDALRGLDDVANGRVKDARAALADIKRRRAAPPASV